MELLRRIWYLLNRRRLERDLADEMAFHREMMDRAGNGGFGNSLRLREESRDAWGWTGLDRLWQDLCYGTRVLRRSPGFSATAILVLALGIGVNLTGFQLFNLMVLRPLPVREPETLVRLTRRAPDSRSSAVAYAAAEFYRANNSVLAAMLVQTDAELLFGRESGGNLRARFVSANYFTELGAAAAYGRVFDPATEARGDAPATAVISHTCWERRFGGSLSVLGRAVPLNGKPVVVIGIAPFGFTGVEPENTEVWIPIRQYPYLLEGSSLLTDLGGRGVDLYGRLKPGVSLQAAREGLRPAAAELYRRYPKDIWKGEWLEVEPGGYATRMEGNDAAVLVFVLMFLVLAAACANVGSLQLARGVAREREFRVRASLGASRWRVFRQLLTESFLLSCAAAAVSLAFSHAVAGLILRWLEAPEAIRPALDWRVAVYTFAMALLASALFGAAPALHAARQRRPVRARSVMVSVQVASSCALLIVGGLFLRSLTRVFTTDFGFDHRGALTIDPRLYEQNLTPEATLLRLGQMRDQVRQVSGVESVALVTMAPLGNARWSSGADGPSGPINAITNAVEPAFFELMRIPLLQGRNFRPGETGAVIVSESLARKLWPGQNPLGKRYSRERTEVVIGVAGSARTIALEDSDAVELYHPFPPQIGELQRRGHLLVRTAGAPATFIPALREALKDGGRSGLRIDLLEDLFRRKTETAARASMLTGAGALLVLLISALGVAGLLSYAVSQRTREIGIRMALGAPRGGVVRLVLRQVAVSFAVGLAAGIGIGYAVALGFRSELYGLSQLDPPSYAGAVTILAASAAAAAWIPTRRALSVNPAQTLRQD